MFERPTLTALARQARADMSAALGTVILRASIPGVMAKVLAGLVHGLYGYLDWISRQAVPFTATGAFLVAWAALVGIYRKAASTAAGAATFAGTPGSPIPAGTRLARAADGVAYVTTQAASIGAGSTATVPIVAEAAGALGNALQGAAVALVGALSGIVSSATLATAATGGADKEGEEDFRERMLARYQAPPEGGAIGDYERWALEVPGVTRVWVAPNGLGAGTVLVRFMRDEANAAGGGFPSGTDGVAASDPRAVAATGDQLAVAEHIRPLQPVTALVYAASPTAQAVDLIIANLSGNDASIKAGIRAAVAEMLLEFGEPGGTIYPNQINAAIDGVAGVTRFALVQPAGPVTVAPGALPVLGAVIYT